MTKHCKGCGCFVHDTELHTAFHDELVKFRSCGGCGCVVHDTEQHTAFHERQTLTEQTAMDLLASLTALGGVVRELGVIVSKHGHD